MWVLKMDEASKKRRGCFVVGIWGSSILLGFSAVYLSFSEVISESTTIILLVISLSLFVVGFITLLWWAKRKPQAKTRDDSQREEG
jgi:hypothetical protein